MSIPIHDRAPEAMLPSGAAVTHVRFHVLGMLCLLTFILYLGKDQSQGSLTIICANTPPGPFNMPLVVRATVPNNGRPAVAESEVEISLEK